MKLNNLKNLDKRTLTYLGIGIGSIVILIILLITLKLIVGNRINSKQLEKKMKSAAVEYYKKYPDKLPKNDGNKIIISIDELVKAGNLKSLDKLLDKGLTCEGNVSVSNNNGHYLYQPNIKCSDNYETNLLYKKILSDNKVVTSGNGLYKINDYYLYRGENLNNYVTFANMKWQIVKINNDNTIRLILVNNLDNTVWDDRYNVEKNDSVGKNDYSISRIKEQLDEYFKGDMFSDEDKAMIVPQDLCIGYRSENSYTNDGSVECSKKLDNQPLGLLQVNEYVLASLEPTCKHIYDNQCRNYNYLSRLNTYWTLTANSKNSYQVYKVSGTVDSYYTYTYAQPKLVINLSSDALYSDGDGSESNPYKIK